jgi:hypothetical protein
MRGRGSVLLALSLCGCAMVGYEPEPLPSGAPAGSVPAPGVIDGAGSGSASSRAGSGASSVGTPGAGSGAGNAGSGAAGSAAGGAGAPTGLTVSCAAHPDGEPCDDGLFCTVDERCEAEQCTGGAARECANDSNGCAVVKCEEPEQACVAMPMSEGLACGSGGFCYQGNCTRLAGPCTEPSTCSRVCIASSLPCLFDCSPSDACEVTCTPLSACFVLCEGTGDCRLDCAQNAFCQLDCATAERCEAECQPGSFCVVECGEAQDCTRLRCAPGAQCVAECEGNAACSFEECDAGQVTCPNGTIACGMCPSGNAFNG